MRFRLIVILISFIGTSYSQSDSISVEIDSMSITKGGVCYLKDLKGVITFYDTVFYKVGFANENYLILGGKTNADNYNSALYYHKVLIRKSKLNFVDL